MAKTIIQKVWDRHVVAENPGAPALLYIDLHLVHEVTSPQAFSGLRERGLKVRRPDLTFGTTDHSIPTHDRSLPIVDKVAETQITQFEKNCRDFGIPYYGPHSAKQGIVHIIGPEQGLTQPGMTVVIEGEHQCMTTRGVHKPGVSMVTSRMLGVFRTDPSTRREVLSMIGTPSGGTGEYV